MGMTDIYTFTIVCSNGAIRLVDGSSELEGRVEICLNNTWGTVCNRGWQNVDAMVACRQAGHSTIGKSHALENRIIA